MNLEKLTLNEMVIMAQQGDKDAMAQVIERFMPFIYKMVGNLYIKGMDSDDLKQIGCTSIIYSIKKFNPLKTKNFTSYVTMAIRNNYYYEARKKMRESFDVSLETEVAENLTLEDMLESDFDLEEEYLKLDEIESLKNVIKQLTKDEKELLYYIYKEPKKSINKYAEKTGLSNSAVYKRKIKLFKKIKLLIPNM